MPFFALQRVIFVNSYDTVRHFWITNQSSLISRPTFHTFHSVVSTSQGFTIGTSPWDESCKRRRKAAGTALNRPATQSYMPILDLESCASIKELLEDCASGTRDIDPGPHLARFALNTSLTLNYGFRIEGSAVSSTLLKEITHVEREISHLRSTSNNWQDYVPLLRLWGAQNPKAKEYRARRDKYLGDMLRDLQGRIAQGTDKPCITGNILKDPEAKLNEAELKSICLTMVSAGLDTVPGTLIMGLAYLSTPHGQEIQERALQEIMKVYPEGNAWEMCLHEEKVPYVTALVKETLRFWTVIPICLPRTSIRDIEWEGVTVPAGTTFFMVSSLPAIQALVLAKHLRLTSSLANTNSARLQNAYAADYDPVRFPSPHQFQPERYLSDTSTSEGVGSAGGGTPHYAYGAGSRMCAGTHLANRELYTAYIRIISAFRLTESKRKEDRPVIDCIECNAVPTSLTTDPKPFKIGLVPRDEGGLREWIRESEEATKGL